MLLAQTVSYKKRLSYLLIAIVIFKIIISLFVELGNDEVYYYTYALRPDWNYFDHPLMVGVFIRLTTFNLLCVNDVTMRLGAIIGSAFASYFIFLTATVVKNEKAGWYATLLYNCSLYGSIISGLFILPDAPQMPFYTASLYVMSLLLFTNSIKKFSLFLLLGLLIGMATLSKVHALFLWVGFGLFILLKQKNYFAKPALYLSGVITIFCLLPIIIWNIHNHFITYTFHSERVTHTTIQFDSFLKELIGEFLYQNPIVFITVIVAFIFFTRQKQAIKQPKIIWLLCLSMPMLFTFWLVSLFNNTLPHWSGPAFIPLLIITAIYLSEKSIQFIPVVIKWAMGLVIVIFISGVVFANIIPVNLGSTNYENYGEYSPLLDISGWKKFGENFAVLVKKDRADNRMKHEAPIIINKWFPGAHIEMYVASQTQQTVIGIGSLQDLHEFAWLNEERRKLALGDDAYCIVPSNTPFDIDNYKTYFQTIEVPTIINQSMGKKLLRYFKIYRLKNCIRIPEKVLP